MIAKSNDAVAKKEKYLWPCINTFYKDPMVIERAEGMRVWDNQGKTYLDFFGGVLTVSVGHCNTEVLAAMEAQQKKVQHTSTLYVTQPAIDLAEKLAELTPGRLQKSFFTNSGTEADETAVMLAKQHTGAHEIVVLRHSYSGRSQTALAMCGHSTWRVVPSAVPGVVHAAAPYCYRCPFGLSYPSCELRCAKDIEELIQTTTTGHIAAFVAEPIMGVGGFITPPKEYFKEVERIVRKYGGLLVIDEVQTAWGRSGEGMFGISYWEVEPDVMTFAKGMANGVPIGATIAAPEVADSFKTLTFSTFGGNPVTCAAALAVIGYIEKNQLVANARQVGAYLKEKLMALQQKYPVIGDVRGMGLMQALELVHPDKSPNPQAVSYVFEKTREFGLLIGKGGLWGNVIRIGPPLTCSRNDVDEAAKALDRAFESLPG
ncbi:MAG: aspartate aminotransferase family protein [Acidobacteriota bacterium]